MLGIEIRNASRGVSTLLPVPDAGLALADLTYDRSAGPFGVAMRSALLNASGWVAFVDQSAKPIIVTKPKKRIAHDRHPLEPPACVLAGGSCGESRSPADESCDM